MEFEAVCLVVFAAVALVSDVRERRLPNRLTVAGLVVALALRAFAGGAALFDGLEAAGIAFAVSMPLFLLGAIGGGDAKLLTALGSFVGMQHLWPGMLLSGALGGVLAVILVVRRHVAIPALLNAVGLGGYILTAGRRGTRPTLARPGAITVPYGVALSLGFVAARFLPLSRLG